MLGNLSEGHFFYFRGNKYRVDSVDLDSGIITATEATTLQQYEFSTAELFGEDETFYAAPTLAELDRQVKLWQPLVEAVDALQLPESFLEKAATVVDTVENVDEALERAEANAIKAGHKFKQTETLKTILRQLAQPVSMSTYYEYRKLYTHYSGNHAAIAASFRRSTFNQLRITKTQLHFIDTLISRHYAGPNRLRKRQLYRLAQSVLEHTKGVWPNPSKFVGAVPDNLIESLFDDRIPIEAVQENPEFRNKLEAVVCPSERWCYGYLKYYESLPDHGKNVIVARYGQEEWEARYMVFETFVQNASRILQYVFADHWLTDVFVVDDNDQPVRLWLTLLIDVYSRSVLGFTVSRKGPSIESIQDALFHAIWPKTSHIDLGLDEPWPVHGIPQQLSLDNAWAHHSHSLEDLTKSISNRGQYPSISLDFRPPYKGRYGAIVERLFGNFSDQMKQLLPGAIQSSKYKDVANAKKRAVLVNSDLNLFLHQLILRYQHTSHTGLGGMTPHEKWMEGLKMGVPIVPNLTLGTKRLFWRMLPNTRKITSKGISAFGMSYWSSGLDGAQRVTTTGRKVEYSIRYRAEDIGTLAVFRDGHYITDVKAKELRLPSGEYLKLSLVERYIALQLAKENNQSARDWLQFTNQWEQIGAKRSREYKRRQNRQKRAEQRLSGNAANNDPKTRSHTIRPDSEIGDYYDDLFANDDSRDD